MAYGLRPVHMAGSAYNTGGFIELPIENDTLGTAIYNGGPVAYTVAATTAATGISANDTPLDNDDSIGVLVGARGVNAAGEQKWGQYYDGVSTNEASSAFGFVVPAKDVIFKIQGSAAWDRKYTGYKNLVTGSTGSTVTGNSSISLTLAAADGTNAGLVVVGVLENGNETTSTPAILVRFIDAAIQQQLG